MYIENNILRYYLRNVYFITGTAYAGKSTTVRMLADRYNMVFCGENYFSAVTDKAAQPDLQPDLCYMRSLKDWKDFVMRSPGEYERWMFNTGREAAGFEVAELISLSRNRNVIADTSIPIDILKEISDYDHVAVMLSPQSMSVERFFDRSDPDKQFLLQVIEKGKDAGMNFLPVDPGELERKQQAERDADHSAQRPSGNNAGDAPTDDRKNCKQRAPDLFAG